MEGSSARPLSSSTIAKVSSSGLHLMIWKSSLVGDMDSSGFKLLDSKASLNEVPAMIFPFIVRARNLESSLHAFQYSDDKRRSSMCTITSYLV